jgi:hypothetical protein
MFAAVLFALMQTPVVPATGCSPSADEVRAAVKTARAEHPSDNTAFEHALDAALGRSPGNEYVEIHSDATLMVLLIPRYMAFRQAMSDALRKMEPVESVGIADGHGVAVFPRQMWAPDIIKIVLQRNGETIAPISNNLKPQTLTNRMGASVTIHTGEVFFPCSAFSPDGTVTITAIPEAAGNMVKTLTPDEMKKLR